MHKLDVVCIKEAYLDSTKALDANNLEIVGYNLLRTDHVSNGKGGGVLFILWMFTCLEINWCSLSTKMLIFWNFNLWEVA